jgi:hypothetical protein
MMLEVRKVHRQEKTDENIARIKELVYENRRIIIHELATFTGRCAAKMEEKWHTGDWFLHHENAAAHSALSV